MKNRHLINILFFLALCTSIQIPAQTQALTGKVTDEASQPLEFANIVLLSLPDSAFVQGTVSDRTGVFTLSTNGQSGLLRISSIGYANAYKACKGNGETGTIRLTPDTLDMDEVVVKGNLPRTRIKGGSMITQVEGTLLEKAGTAENLLDKIPNLSAADGTVQVFGRGSAEIYINGRKVRDASELDQLPADNIKAVEVISNPGARYAASVKAVVRISTKKTPGDGFGFNNRTYVRYDEKWSALEQFNFNYRSGSFDVGGMLYGQSWSTAHGRDIAQDTYLEKHWEQKSSLKNEYSNKNLAAQLSLNYAIRPEHTVGARYQYTRLAKSKLFMDMNTTVRQDGIPAETTRNRSVSPSQRHIHDLNLYYSGKAGGWTIDLNADGMWMDGHENQKAEEAICYPDGTSGNQTITTFNPATSRLCAAKLTAEHPLWDGSLSVGAEYSYAKRTSVYTNPEQIIRENDNRIEEDNASAFVEYSRSFGKLSLQAGVRYEHIDFDYYEQGKRADEQSRSYENLFPSASLSFPLGNVQMQLGYARDIERPSYNDLSSSVYYGNRYTYQTGNPSLQPTLTDNLTLTAIYRWMQLQAGYQHIRNAVFVVSEAYEKDNPSIALIGLTNAPAYDQCFASLTLSPTIGIWSPQLTTQFTRQWVEADTPQGRRKLNAPCMDFIWQNTFLLPAGLQLDVEVDWSTKGYMQNMYRHHHLWNVDLALQRSFLSDRLSLRLDVHDLFKTWERGSSQTTYAGALRVLKQDTYSTRVIRLTARYNFNIGKSKYKGTGAGQEQKNRL